MLTEFELKFLQKTLTGFCKLGLMPIDVKGRHIKHDDSKLRALIACLGIAFHIFFIIFSVCRMQSQSQTEMIFAFFLMLASIAAIATAITIWCYSVELVQLYYNVLQLNQSFGK